MDQSSAPLATNDVALSNAPDAPNDSQDSQTAAEYISSQLQLEAEAREVLPYQFDACTHALGPLRQTVFSCLTCNPPPSNPTAPYTPAGVCYACSISCHGEHELVELFTRRNFVCDCGTTRTPATAPCTLRINDATGTKGGVVSTEPSATNQYNHNFRNRFCGCGELYDPLEEEGTMYQCYGIGNVEDGGCGEDWWHPECLMGMSRDWHKQQKAVDGMPTATQNDEQSQATTATESQPHDGTARDVQPNENTQTFGSDPEDRPNPPGFPDEEDFEHLICYKCTDAFPWIKRYAGTAGFLAGVPNKKIEKSVEESTNSLSNREIQGHSQIDSQNEHVELSKKRKADDEIDESAEQSSKRPKPEDETSSTAGSDPQCKYEQLPQQAPGQISLFLKEDFRDHLCRCKSCFPRMVLHPHLLEEEVVYEPPMSNPSSVANGDAAPDGSASVGSRSLLERGEAALSNMDRVKAIEGVMVYNHLRDKVKDFLKPFAESGQTVGAEDVKKYFEKLRGDEEAIKLAQMRKSGDDDGQEPDNRREQGGY